jgi:repressor LexA
MVHPCFNNNSTVIVHEQIEGETDWVVQHSVKISEYLAPTVKDGFAMRTLKRFFPEGARIRLQPANPNMEPLFVAAADVQVQGIVVGLMRKF